MKLWYKIIDWILLLLILVIVGLMYLRMPPTVGEIRKANIKTKQKLWQKYPVVKIVDPIEVIGTVDVDGSVCIENEPLDVNITNRVLSVDQW